MPLSPDSASARRPNSSLALAQPGELDSRHTKNEPMPIGGRSMAVERLVSELGRASSGLYLVHGQGEDAAELNAAHKLLTHAAEWAARVAREPDDADLGVVAAAWEAIAVAQDLVANARRLVDTAREQRLAAAALRAEARSQAAHAHAHAERLRRWSARHHRRERD